MGIRNFYMIIIGVFVVICLIVMILIQTHGKRNKYKGGKRVINDSTVLNIPYFKEKLLKYKIYTIIVSLTMIAIAFIIFVMLARPYKEDKSRRELYNRDIVLCIDISASVDNLNMNLIQQLEETVKQLDGERFGIIMFNTSPCTLVPLTDDYEYIIEQLEMIRYALQYNISRGNADFELADLDNEEANKYGGYIYLTHYITEGTLVGVDERGSSLIGDGLASTVSEFKDKDRTKIVIFTSDNDLDGEPLFTMSEAADLCKKNNVTVFGIGTKEMKQENMMEMKRAVEKTGGTFFLEESSGTFKQIISEIENTSKSLLKTETDIKAIDVVAPTFIILIILIGLMFTAFKILKK